MRQTIYSISLWLLVMAAHAQRPVPGPVQTKSILLINGTAHIGDGTRIEKAAIGFRGGKIVLVEDMQAPSLRQDEYDTVIDASGKHIYPGFILLHTTLGLREVDAVRATLDYGETGELKPEVRSVMAWNTDSRIIPTVRRNGVLLAQPTPQGGLISGQSGLVQLDAWNWEDAVIRMEDGVHIHWPARWRSIGSMEETELLKIQEERTAHLQLLTDLLQRAKAHYLQGKTAPYNLKCTALHGLFDGSKTAYLHVESAYEIMESVNFLENLGVKKIVLVGASNGLEVLPFIAEHHLPVILHRLHHLPVHADDDVRLPYKMASIFSEAGITVALSYDGDMEAMGSRNLPFLAGTAVAYGMDYEKAVQLITLNAAKITGTDQRLGSLTVGKDATLFISDGDALDMLTNRLSHAWISGREITLDSFQEELWQRYSGKYGVK